MDLVTTSDRFPIEGETIIGNHFNKYPGGKGANQAVAAARLGAEVYMIGCVGDDSNGDYIKKHLEKEKIDIDSIFTIKDSSTGIAHISTAENENKIVVVPGANYSFRKNMIEKSMDIIKDVDIILLQLEIPINIVGEIINVAEANNVPVILNPAPAIDIPKRYLSGVSYITPNESELSLLTNTHLNSLEEYGSAFNKIHNMGVENIIVTRGEKGAIFSDKVKIKNISAKKVDVVDTTGAGDTFNGALAFALARGIDLFEGVNFANYAASASVTKAGAQSGMPFMSELEI